jgi:hypothetical protein
MTGIRRSHKRVALPALRPFPLKMHCTLFVLVRNMFFSECWYWSALNPLAAGLGVKAARFVAPTFCYRSCRRSYLPFGRPRRKNQNDSPFSITCRCGDADHAVTGGSSRRLWSRLVLQRLSLRTVWWWPLLRRKPVQSRLVLRSQLPRERCSTRHGPERRNILQQSKLHLAGRRM